MAIAPRPKSMNALTQFTRDITPPTPQPVSLPKEVDELLDVMAWTALGEAANQGPEGMAAVLHAGINRSESGRYPSDLKKVFLQPQQFSAWNPGQGGNSPKKRYPKDSAEFKQARKIAEQVVTNVIPDPTGEATHYWAPAGMRAMGLGSDPYWAKSEESRFGRLKLGDHVFLPNKLPPRDIPNPPQPAVRPASVRANQILNDIPPFQPLPKPAPLTFPKRTQDEAITGSPMVRGRVGNQVSPRLDGAGDGMRVGVPIGVPYELATNQRPTGGFGSLVDRSVNLTTPVRMPSAPGAGLTAAQRNAIASVQRPQFDPGDPLRREAGIEVAPPRAPVPRPFSAGTAARMRVAGLPGAIPPTAAEQQWAGTNFGSPRDLPGVGSPSFADVQAFSRPLMPGAPVPATASALTQFKRSLPPLPQTAAAPVPMPASMRPQVPARQPVGITVVGGRSAPSAPQPRPQPSLFQSGGYLYAPSNNGFVKVGKVQQERRRPSGGAGFDGSGGGGSLV